VPGHLPRAGGRPAASLRNLLPECCLHEQGTWWPCLHEQGTCLSDSTEPPPRASVSPLTCTHGTIGWFGLEGTLWTILFQPPAVGRDPFHQPRVLRAPSNLALNTAREGAVTASLGSLCQDLTTLIVQHFPILTSLNLPSARLKPFTPFLYCQACYTSHPGTGWWHILGCDVFLPQPGQGPFSAKPQFILSCYGYGAKYPTNSLSSI